MANKAKASNSLEHNNDTQTKHLLPLEYCSIERAARLLGCEVEDLWHWREIGAINFCINVGWLRKTESNPFEDDVWDEWIAEASPSKHKKGSNPSEYGVEDERDIEALPLASIKPTFLKDFSQWCHANRMFDTELLSYSGDVYISGFWIFETNERLGEKYYFLIPYMGGLNPNITYNPYVYFDENPTFLIMRSDLERLYDALYNGTPLQNRYNNEAIKRATEEREQQRKEVRPRVSAQHREFIKFALKHMLDMDDKDLETPSEVTNRLNEYMKEHNYSDSFDYDNVRKWLSN
jgi:hypothetical protein